MNISIQFIFSVQLFLLFFPLPTLGAHIHPESSYVEQWCRAHNGRIEVVLPDKTRCDCVTDTHAVEFDFGEKWYEAVGQSLYYGLQTGKKPGIVLILEEESDQKYWLRLNSTILHYDLPIDTWEVSELEPSPENMMLSIIHLLLLKE